MDRFYWYTIGLRTEFNFFVDSIKESTFNQSDEQGFKVEAISRDMVVGKFVQSKLVTQEFINPFGDNTVERRQVYDVIDFKFSRRANILLETKNPGRCTKTFFNELLKCSDYSLVVEAPKFKLPELIKELKAHGLIIIQVKEIELADIALSKDATGLLVVKGNLSIDDYELKLPLADLKHRLKKFKAIVDFHGTREMIEVHSSNKIIMSDKLAKLITPIIYKTLRHIDS
ncbi:hypothetical protein [Pseudoalteromonas sp. McH1-42]|uniref:hypothetical protein n=1 Tax=Pseudoalteromonas sp. McH1-42 TaxID=2917752 RepID=UPI001EF4A17A|nr:hypothetical protein [Pseudoalteromonas sp. McH1-42]MCG7561056.1 hypothetical protein [Pseudoalteromonas sp. McH1-42]